MAWKAALIMTVLFTGCRADQHEAQNQADKFMPDLCDDVDEDPDHVFATTAETEGSSLTEVGAHSFAEKQAVVAVGGLGRSSGSEKRQGIVVGTLLTAYSFYAAYSAVDTNNRLQNVKKEVDKKMKELATADIADVRALTAMLAWLSSLGGHCSENEAAAVVDDFRDRMLEKLKGNLAGRCDELWKNAAYLVGKFQGDDQNMTARDAAYFAIAEASPCLTDGGTVTDKLKEHGHEGPDPDDLRDPWLIAISKYSDTKSMYKYFRDNTAGVQAGASAASVVLSAVLSPAWIASALHLGTTVKLESVTCNGVAERIRALPDKLEKEEEASSAEAGEAEHDGINSPVRP